MAATTLIRRKTNRRYRSETERALGSRPQLHKQRMPDWQNSPVKTVRAWAKVTRGELVTVSELYDDRADAIRHINRPAAESVIEVKIMQVKPSQAARIRRLTHGKVDLLTAAVAEPRKFVG